jgi:hypothetical protein
MSRVAWELDLSRRYGKCPLCDSDEVEDVEHILLHCPAHQHHRSKMMASAAAVYATANNGAELGAKRHSACCSGPELEAKRKMSSTSRSEGVEETKESESLAINDRLGRQDVVWAEDWGWSKPQLTDKSATHRRKCRAKRPLSTGRPSMVGEASGGQRAQQRGRYSP